MNTRRAPKAAAIRRSMGIFEKLDVMCRYLMLSLLWTVSLLLLVTAPAGTRALLETANGWATGDESGVTKTFIWHFRQQFGTVLAVGAIIAGFALLLTVNFTLISHMGDQRSILMPALGAIAIPALIVAANVFPANIGRRYGIRDSFTATAVRTVTSPVAALLTVLLVVFLAFAIYIQPLLALVLSAPTARMVVAAHAKFTRHLITQD